MLTDCDICDRQINGEHESKHSIFPANGGKLVLCDKCSDKYNGNIVAIIRRSGCIDLSSLMGTKDAH